MKIINSIFATSIILGVGFLTLPGHAHQNGLRDYPGGFEAVNKSCGVVQRTLKTILRRQARAHCQGSHDSGSNALRNTSYRKGSCTKVKPNDSAFNTTTVTGAVFTAQCR